MGVDAVVADVAVAVAAVAMVVVVGTPILRVVDGKDNILRNACCCSASCLAFSDSSNCSSSFFWGVVVVVVVAAAVPFGTVALTVETEFPTPPPPFSFIPATVVDIVPNRALVVGNDNNLRKACCCSTSSVETSALSLFPTPDSVLPLSLLLPGMLPSLSTASSGDCLVAAGKWESLLSSWLGDGNEKRAPIAKWSLGQTSLGSK
mmetsp:Transcript_18637/g.50972  ORF Transcript_18637/g.50972 Transcript_18637/m.50972 type:complete len:205 (-) Transcript_18637:1362-1976(-)